MRTLEPVKTILSSPLYLICNVKHLSQFDFLNLLSDIRYDMTCIGLSTMSSILIFSPTFTSTSAKSLNLCNLISPDYPIIIFVHFIFYRTTIFFRQPISITKFNPTAIAIETTKIFVCYLIFGFNF